MHKKRYQFLLLSALALLISTTLTSCGNDDPPPPISLDQISNAATAETYVRTIYESMTERDLFTDGFLMLPLLFSDQAKYVGNENISWKQATNFNFSQSTSALNSVLIDLYGINSSVSFLINEVDTTVDQSLTDDFKAGMIGEARAIRGVLYYYLTQYWDRVPLIVNTDNNLVDSLVSQPTSAELFTQIAEDLKFGAENIEKNRFNNSNQRISEWGAKAYLARLYLSVNNYDSARVYAEDVIRNSGAVLETDLSNIYTFTSSEHIWILPENEDDVGLSIWFLPSFTGGQQVVVPRTDFFEDGDLRKFESINSTGEYIKKYDDAANANDPLFMIRLAEMYLIAAEAAAAQNDFPNANIYVNELRSRAGLSDLDLNASNYIDLILQEKNAELCFEGPHRWLDLKRTGQDIATLSPLGDYTTTDRLWPFSTTFLDAFSQLMQNDGY